MMKTVLYLKKNPIKINNVQILNKCMSSHCYIESPQAKSPRYKLSLIFSYYFCKQSEIGKFN